MTITKLIDKLEKAKEKYGDIVVARLNEDYEQGEYHYTITKIIHKKNSGLLDDGESPAVRTYIYLK